MSNSRAKGLKQACVFAVWQSVFATMYTFVVDANVVLLKLTS
jgi:hypothetical protein